ncbi:MAG: Maf family nucleotide pyrophosphatase [Proteobacteria bacterium]|nr:Maf family nucleotide pyrophosphatase [Pseudomonadota bacterium]
MTHSNQISTRLILASTSPYRKRQLENLGIRFSTIAPVTDETPLPRESPRALAERLGTLKAGSVVRLLEAADEADTRQPWVVIGSDQVCHLGDTVFHKPGNRETAAEHLRLFSDQWVTFTTSLALLTSLGQRVTVSEDFHVHFRQLDDAMVATYLDLDEPWDCAGSIKVEQAGVALLDDMKGRDINTLYGLPLMALSDQLASLGYSIFDFR